jgi:hypothetical protein
VSRSILSCSRLSIGPLHAFIRSTIDGVRLSFGGAHLSKSGDLRQPLISSPFSPPHGGDVVKIRRTPHYLSCRYHHSSVTITTIALQQCQEEGGHSTYYNTPLPSAGVILKGEVSKRCTLCRQTQISIFICKKKIKRNCRESSILFTSNIRIDILLQI